MPSHFNWFLTLLSLHHGSLNWHSYVHTFQEGPQFVSVDALVSNITMAVIVITVKILAVHIWLATGVDRFSKNMEAISELQVAER